MSVEIRRSNTRFHERAAGRASWHSLSFGPNYDPDNLAFGPMVCHDEHLLADGAGFDDHHHEGVVIASRVITGALRHTDSGGMSTDLEPGATGVFTPGDGMSHSEIAAAPATRFVQTWLRLPPAQAPGYRVIDGDHWSMPAASLAVRRLGAGEAAFLPARPKVHVFIAAGALARFSLAEPLSASDAIRLVDEPAHEITAAVPSTVLVWSFDAAQS
ncbi:MAG: pirin family protein [Nocardioides sp.]